MKLPQFLPFLLLIEKRLVLEEKGRIQDGWSYLIGRLKTITHIYIYNKACFIAKDV